MSANLNRFQPESASEQIQSEYVPCRECRDVVHVNALSEDGLCPECVEEERYKEDYRYDTCDNND